MRPHVEPERSVRSTALQRPGRVRRVAVLGAISVAEGGLLLQALATDARKRDLPLHFTIVGYSDPALTGGLERAGVIETGRYSTDDPTLDRVARAALQIAEAGRNWEDDETLDLVTQVSPDLVLLPSIWPETYSYTLSLALRTGLPVVAFKLGEPSERLKAYPNGHLHLLPYVIAANPAAFNDQMLAINLSANCRISGSIHASKYNNMLHEYYSLKY
ncbi:glycosyltransferase involved in cell wall biosynthesis [Methylobacterium sp. PvP062]